MEGGGTPAQAAADMTATATTAPRGVAAQQPSGRTLGLLRAALAANPMTGLIGAFRAASLGTPIPWRELGISSACTVLVFVVGCLYFRRVEDGFADII